MNPATKLLAEKNMIIIDGDINETTLNNIQESFGCILFKAFSVNPTKFPEITVMISSHGGSHDLKIYDFLSTYPGKKVGFVLNYAQSAAATILQACDVRIATEYSDILVHNGEKKAVAYDTFLDDTKTKEFVEGVRADAQKRWEILVKRTKMTLEEVKKLFAEDRNLSPGEALKLGLIDRIWTGPLPFNAEGRLDWSKPS
ncbi:MAG: ATP-dependent Clp protease proteolytic subunit [Minisyncoccia bacterium]